MCVRHEGRGAALQAHLAAGAQVHQEQQDAQPHQVGLAIDAPLGPARVGQPSDRGAQTRQEVAHALEQQIYRAGRGLVRPLPPARLSGPWRWMIAMLILEISLRMRLRRL